MGQNVICKSIHGRQDICQGPGGGGHNILVMLDRHSCYKKFGEPICYRAFVVSCCLFVYHGTESKCFCKFNKYTGWRGVLPTKCQLCAKWIARIFLICTVINGILKVRKLKEMAAMWFVEVKYPLTIAIENSYWACNRFQTLYVFITSALIPRITEGRPRYNWSVRG